MIKKCPRIPLTILGCWPGGKNPIFNFRDMHSDGDAIRVWKMHGAKMFKWPWTGP